mgnify:CR=1 FL=1
MDPSEYGMELIARLVAMQGKPVDYEVVTPAEAPVLENIWRGGEADIYGLPAARYHEKDVGYIRLIVIGLKLTVNRERAADLPLLSRLGRHLRKMSRLII